MAKQLLKSSLMVALVVTLAFVTGVVSAHGQTHSPLRANVPFDFTVASTNFTAGTYQIAAMDTQGDTIRVQSTSGAQNAVRLGIQIGGSAPSKTSKLVFHRYGDRYFLAEIWKAGESYGKKLQTSKAEKALTRELAAIDRARSTNTATYERVEIAANCPK